MHSRPLMTRRLPSFAPPGFYRSRALPATARGERTRRACYWTDPCSPWFASLTTAGGVVKHGPAALARPGARRAQLDLVSRSGGAHPFAAARRRRPSGRRIADDETNCESETKGPPGEPAASCQDVVLTADRVGRVREEGYTEALVDAHIVGAHWGARAERGRPPCTRRCPLRSWSRPWGRRGRTNGDLRDGSPDRTGQTERTGGI